MVSIQYDNNTGIARMEMRGTVLPFEVINAIHEIYDIINTNNRDDMVFLFVSKCIAFSSSAIRELTKVAHIVENNFKRVASVHENIVSLNQAVKFSESQNFRVIRRFNTENEALKYLIG